MIVLVPLPDPSFEFPREKAMRVLHHMAFRVEARAYDDGVSAIGLGGGAASKEVKQRAFDSVRAPLSGW